jgi:hypothetical protein
MDVYIHRIGIHGTGVLLFMRVIPITRITGDMEILIQDMITGDMVVIITIRAHLLHVILVIKEVEITDKTSVQQDPEMEEQEQFIMDKLELTGQMVFFLVQPEA